MQTIERHPQLLQVEMKCESHIRRTSLYGRCDCVRRARVKTRTQCTSVYALTATLSARPALDFRQWPDVDGTWTKGYGESEDRTSTHRHSVRFLPCLWHREY